MTSIVMGHTPSDVDLIGLSKSIHMKSTEKQFQFDNSIDLDSNIDQSSKATPKFKIENARKSQADGPTGNPAHSSMNQFSLSLKSKNEKIAAAKANQTHKKSLFDKKSSVSNFNQTGKASNRYNISSRPSYERDSQVLNSRESFVTSRASERNEDNSLYMDTDGTDLNDFLLNEQLVIIQSTVGDQVDEEHIK